MALACFRIGDLQAKTGWGDLAPISHCSLLVLRIAWSHHTCTGRYSIR